MLTLFTARVDHLSAPDRDDAIDDLANALHDEFPAYIVSNVMQAGAFAAILVATLKPSTPAPVKLNGWGHGPLKLSLVG